MESQGVCRKPHKKYNWQQNCTSSSGLLLEQNKIRKKQRRTVTQLSPGKIAVAEILNRFFPFLHFSSRASLGTNSLHVGRGRGTEASLGQKEGKGSEPQDAFQRVNPRAEFKPVRAYGACWQGCNSQPIQVVEDTEDRLPGAPAGTSCPSQGQDSPSTSMPKKTSCLSKVNEALL